MEIINLKARIRDGKGKGYTRKIRNQGWVPAVYYGHDRETRTIEVDAREFCAIVRNKQTTHLINLELPGETGDGTSVIKEIQKHVLKDNFYFHVDFQHVAMDEKITVNVPIHITGTAVGVKEDGGILNHPKRTLLVECLPSDIPEFIEVDVSALRIGHAIHVSDLITIAGAVIKDSPEDVVAVVAHPQAVVEATPVAAAGEVVAAETANADEGAGKEEKADKGKKTESAKSSGKNK